MNSRHIEKILDRTDLSRIPAAEMAEIDEHTRNCRTCRADFQAARIASALLKENASIEPLSPSPFFQAKVLNARRDRQSPPKSFAAFRRWWQASATLVLLLCVLVFGLITANIAASRSVSASAVTLNNEPELDFYSAETIIINPQKPRGLTTEQVFELLDDDKGNASDNEKELR